MVIPLGDRDNQELTLVEKRGGAIHTTTVSGVRFVPLLGQFGFAPGA
jgi:protein-L-isoaspartate O-methyltransferase